VSVRSLAEAIILQSIEDLWNNYLRKECMEFFNGKGFTICTDIAAINLYDQVKLMNFINVSIRYVQKP
jgi:hypothetical protein